MGLSALFIFVIGVLFYSVSWNNPFIFDDIVKIQENVDLKPGTSITETLIYPYTQHSPHLMRNDPSRPLTFLVYRACYAIGGGQAWPFHAASSLFHALNGVLVFLLASLLARKLSTMHPVAVGWMSALFFIFLPINSGSVFYAFAFSDVIATFFLLAALVTFTNKRSWALVVLFYVGALFSKQSAIVLPALLFATDMLLGQFDRKKLMPYLSLLSVAVAYLVLRFTFLGGIGDLEGTDNTFAAWDYFIRQGPMILKYVQLSLVPLDLTIDHGVDPASISVILAAFAWVGILLSAGLCVYVLNKQASTTTNRLIAWAWTFFLITLAPTSSIVPTVDLLVERRVYLGSIALAILFAWVLQLLPVRRVGLIAGSVIIVLFAAVSFGRNQVYSSPLTLWQESARLYPTSKRALVNVGVIHDQFGRFEEAKTIFEAVTAQFPNDAFVHTKLALIYQNPQYSGHSLQRAIEEYNKALELTPNDLATLYNAGLLMLDVGNLDQAEILFKHSLTLNPRFAYGYFGLGMTMLKKQKPSEGRALLEKSLEIDPQLRGARDILQQLPH